MRAVSDLEYLRMPSFKRFFYKLGNWFASVPGKLGRLFVNICRKIGAGAIWVYNDTVDIIMTFRHGDWKTRISFLVMGFGCFARKQILRGILFLTLEAVFILYMVLVGGKFLAQLGTLGTVESYEDEWGVVVYGDNSFRILLYGILSIFFIIALFFTWRLNVKQNKISQEILSTGKKLKSGKDDINSLVDDQFHKTLLALPVVGILIFTVLPIVFMILIAFTNYDMQHTPPMHLFTWIGWSNFNEIFNWSAGGVNYASTFGEILLWTLIWAFFATFTNYFLGMIVAMMINKKGIKLKKLWRTILVISIAIPQFISLLYVSKMFSESGMVNGFLQRVGLLSGTNKLPFWTDTTWARVTVIIINIWIGIPYLMLITTGILMNIPQDLYESARIDGASTWKMYKKITLPYMLFVTGPYLLTSFTANMSNFNVIYLLTGGGPYDVNLTGGAGHTDLLITWLYRLTVTNNNYKMASVIGIMVFLVVAVLSLIVYNILPSMKNEEDFQ